VHVGFQCTFTRKDTARRLFNWAINAEDRPPHALPLIEVARRKAIEQAECPSGSWV
jgi:hypothetical protein